MRKFLFACAALLAVSATSAVRADDKSEINALYAKLVAAMKAKNVKAIMAVGTPDFVSIHEGTKMNAQQTAQMMDQQFKMVKKMDAVKMSVQKVDIKGKTANVTSSYSFSGEMVGPDGKTHKMSDTGLSKDVVVKTPKGWLFKVSETVKSTPMMDGKPFTPEMMGGAPPKPAKK